MKPATVYAKGHVCKTWNAPPSKQGQSPRRRRFLALSPILFHHFVLVVPSWSCFSCGFCNCLGSSTLEMRLADAVKRRYTEIKRKMIGSSRQWNNDVAKNQVARTHSLTPRSSPATPLWRHIPFRTQHFTSFWMWKMAPGPRGRLIQN